MGLDAAYAYSLSRQWDEFHAAERPLDAWDGDGFLDTWASLVASLLTAQERSSLERMVEATRRRRALPDDATAAAAERDACNDYHEALTDAEEREVAVTLLALSGAICRPA